MKKLIAYHGDQKIKDDVLKQLRSHYDADEIIKGTYWENGKGCAVGCTIHSNDHSEYEFRFGIPIILAILEDSIFENLPTHLAKEWPIKFMSAINVGAHLSKIWTKFAVWLLTDPKYGVLQYAKTDAQKRSIQKIADLYSKSENIEINKKEWRNEIYYTSAYYETDAAAYYAIRAAIYTASNYPLEAVQDGESASYYGGGQNAAAREKHRIAQSKKLLELLKECKS